MWKFSGTINFQCEQCSALDSVEIDDFDINCVGSDEGGMGPDAIYEISLETQCNDCDNEISFNFIAREYPVEFLDHVSSEVTGAATTDTPYIEHLPYDIYEVKHFDLAKATIIEIIHEIQADKSVLREITARQFEELIAELFRNKGYQVELTQRTRDGGKDIIAISTDNLGIRLKYFVECKHYAEKNKVGVDVVRSLHGVKNTKDGPNKTIIATTSSFTADAVSFVQKEANSEWDMALADYDRIVEWVETYH